MKGLNRSYLVLAFLFGVVGIVQCVRWSKFGTFTPLYLLNFLPAVAFWIAYVSSRFSRMKTKSFFGGNTGDHESMKEGMPTTLFYTSGSNDDDFPDDFEIMIFDNILKEEDRPPGHYWNHAQTHGVAISKKRDVIVYWAERW